MNYVKQAFVWVEKNITQDFVVLAVAILALLFIYFLIRHIIFGAGSISRGLGRMSVTLNSAGEQNIGNGYAVDELRLPKTLEQIWYVFFEKLTKGDAANAEDYFGSNIITKKAAFGGSYIAPILMAAVGPILVLIVNSGLTSVKYSSDSLWGIVTLSVSAALFAITLIIASRAAIIRASVDMVIAANKSLPIMRPEITMGNAAGRMDLAADRIEAVYARQQSQLAAQAAQVQAQVVQQSPQEPVMAEAVIEGFSRKINANVNTQMTRIMDIMKQLSEAQLNAREEMDRIIAQLTTLAEMQKQLQDKLDVIQRSIEN